MGLQLALKGLFNGVSAKIRYEDLATFRSKPETQLYPKNKYTTHPRSPAIGQTDIVTDFGSRKGQDIPDVFYYSMSITGDHSK